MFLAKFCFYQWRMNMILYFGLLALIITELNVATSVWNGTVGNKVEHHKLYLPVKHI